MAKKVIVGGRIESKEVGGIVTGAAEILDDAKGKKQSVINQETDAELLRLDQSKQDNLTFDNVPTEGSDNPVKSGGLYTAQQAILLAIAAINELIPSAASVLNQLADRAFVNSSISTNTATFRGTSAAGLNEQQFIAWANGLEHDLNDYVFWQTSDAAGNTLFKRYKWNGTEWAYEYTLNNSTFTSEQWEAIQSGITALLVAKLRALPTAQELIQSFDGKQDVLTFDDVPTLGSNNPVKSSGIYNVIKAITDLIPAEATAQNQLADKADVAAKILAAIPSWKGQYDALTDLQAVTGAKAGDMGCVKTTDSDGHAVLTFYQYSAQGAWVVYYTLRHYAQNKPATTGTTGDYPYNGMGRIELQKNIVNGVNTLTQAMLTQQNTIYVIQYDFTLGEDITVPENCILEFDGGSISNEAGSNYILSGNNSFVAPCIKAFSGVIIGSGLSYTYDVVPTSIFKIWDSKCLKSICNLCKEGGTVLFDANFTYTIDESVVLQSKSITIDGCGNEIAITTGNTYCINMITVSNADSFSLKNLNVNGNSDNHEISIKTNQVFIKTNNVKNVYIDSCVFHNIVVDFDTTVYPAPFNFMEITGYEYAEFTNNRIYDVNAPEGIEFRPNELENIIPTEDRQYSSPYLGTYKYYVNPEDHLEDYSKTINHAVICGNKIEWSYVSSAIVAWSARVNVTNNYFGTTVGGTLGLFVYDSDISHNVFAGALRNTAIINFVEGGMINFIPINNLIDNNVAGHCGNFVEFGKARKITIINNRINTDDVIEDTCYQRNSSTFLENPWSFLAFNEGSRQIVVQNNTVSGFTNICEFVKTEDVKILSNNIYCNGVDVILSFVNDAKKVEVKDNIIKSPNSAIPTRYLATNAAIFVRFITTATATAGDNFEDIDIIGNNVTLSPNRGLSYPLYIDVYDIQNLTILPHVRNLNFNDNIINNLSAIFIATDDVNGYSAAPTIHIKNNNMELQSWATTVALDSDVNPINKKTFVNYIYNRGQDVYLYGLFVQEGVEYTLKTANNDESNWPIKVSENASLTVRSFAIGETYFAGALFNHNVFCYFVLQDIIPSEDFVDADVIPGKYIKVGPSVSYLDFSKFVPNLNKIILKPGYKYESELDITCVGIQAFDNGKPVWWDGTQWVDATGTPV